MEWRITGVRRWLPVVLLLSALASTAFRVTNLRNPAVGTIGDGVVLALSVLLAVVALVWTLFAWRARVALDSSGLAVRRIRRRLIPYGEITRVYQDRLASGGVALMLTGNRRVVLPAPVAGLGVRGTEIDEAVEQIRARVAEG